MEKQQQDVYLVLGRSKLMLFYLGVSHTLAISALLILQTPIYFRLLVITLILLSLIFYYRHYQWLPCKTSISTLRVTAKREVYLTYQDGSSLKQARLVSAYVTPRLTILTMHRPRQYFNVYLCLLPDAIDAEQYRQLRVMLNAPNFFQQG